MIPLRRLAGLTLPAAVAVACMSAAISTARAEELVLYGAGSLRGAMTAIAADYSKATGNTVRTAFGPSGLMRDRIEASEAVDLFTSADMEHALTLRRDGRASAVVMFTRNRLCAFAKPGAGLEAASFAQRLLDPSVRIGTSTPKADPGGDYTWEMFRRIDRHHPGAFATLDGKAKKIVGGSTAADPSDSDPIASAFARDDITVMIAYCSGAEQRRQATPDLQVVPVPPPYATGPEYGLAITSLRKPAAVGLMLAILSPEGQATLARFGFDPVGLPADGER
ncbi:substrate-binding domain-containing protein [Azospirillum picis]|uniref:ABC-type molybdate transport system substrate-binding protein n=1 Tax=Azospirillum picis TaxID=488438 RepID=A0ABU0MLZ2_9PROT|nr:substrate-binding domain-containing protein [Azospirillum picis]MBP2300521.1 ABC-type molybdate transport system substrate-binding protein [Azospirillum picis]MDQ0534490.1 ABC-type molybdate transport system substrate-binding protein [Azospirillum picis]